jgi:hypothetical protein
MYRLTVSKTDEQLILPLETLIRKWASRCLLLKWSVKKFNVIIIIIIIIKII